MNGPAPGNTPVLKENTKGAEHDQEKTQQTSYCKEKIFDAGLLSMSRAFTRPPIETCPRFATANLRLANVPDLDASVAELTREHDGGELEARLQEAGVACHRVQNSAAACSDPQLQERGHFVRLESGATHTIVEGTRSKLSRTPARIRRGVPTMGRDNQEILAELLGYDGARMTELAIAGVLE